MLNNGPLTVFNRYYDSVNGYDVYYKSVIEQAWFYAEEINAVTDLGLQSAIKYTVRVPADTLEKSGKVYLNNKEYQKMPPDQVGGYFTFAPSDKLVQGDIDFEWQSGVKGYSIADLEKKYDNVMTVVAYNYRGNGDEPFHHVTGQ